MDTLSNLYFSDKVKGFTLINRHNYSANNIKELILNIISMVTQLDINLQKSRLFPASHALGSFREVLYFVTINFVLYF